jgi:hypothetical protein
MGLMGLGGFLWWRRQARNSWIDNCGRVLMNLLGDKP